MNRVWFAALGAASLLVAAGAAEATTVTETFSGTVTHGTDSLGLFGVSGADLVGQSFTATATFNTTDDGHFPGFHTAGGGAFIARPNPLYDVSMTVNGHVWTIDFDYRDQAFTQYTYHEFRPPELTTGIIRFQEYQDASHSVELFAGEASGLPQYENGTLTLHAGFGFIDLSGMNDGISLTITSATATPVDPAAAIPEPASWALMLTGFGLAGAALRRRSPRNAQVTFRPFGDARPAPAVVRERLWHPLRPDLRKPRRTRRRGPRRGIDEPIDLPAPPCDLDAGHRPLGLRAKGLIFKRGPVAQPDRAELS
jgi:hypothetical protein